MLSAQRRVKFFEQSTSHPREAITLSAHHTQEGNVQTEPSTSRTYCPKFISPEVDSSILKKLTHLQEIQEQLDCSINNLLKQYDPSPEFSQANSLYTTGEKVGRLSTLLAQQKLQVTQLNHMLRESEAKTRNYEESLKGIANLLIPFGYLVLDKKDARSTYTVNLPSASTNPWNERLSSPHWKIPNAKTPSNYAHKFPSSDGNSTDPDEVANTECKFRC